MSQVFSFNGNDDFYPGGSLYPNPKEANLFLSLGRQVDAYFPLQKRSRFTAPIGISGNWFDFEQQKQETSLDTLPDECLFEILRRLPAGADRGNCMSVSKRWLMLLSNICENEICSNESTGNENGEQEEDDLKFGNEGFLTRSLEGKKATDVKLAAMAVGTASRGGLGKLTIRECNSDRPVTDVGLKAIAHGCPSLKVLTLWAIPTISDEGLIEIASRCHQLEKLELGQCPNISGKAFFAIAKNCPSVTHFTIDSCPNIGNEGLQAIGKCPNLKAVSIKNCAGVGDQGIAGLISSASFVLERVVLESLAVSDLALAVIGHYGVAVADLVLNCLPNVSEKGFWVMGNGRGLQKLESLTIVSCHGVTDIGLDAIGKGCPNMKIFQLHKCAFLSDNGLVSFAKAAPSIERLHLVECHRITQIGLYGLLFNCAAKLKDLSLARCYGIKNLNLQLPAVSPCESMKSLSIRDCPGFGDVTIAVLGKLCPQLEHVELNGLSGITDAGFLSLLESSMGCLFTVNLSGCTNLTDQVVLPLVKLHGDLLEVLNLNGCQKISDLSLNAIAYNCTSLRDLDVSRCGITDIGITALAHGKLFDIKVLSLAGCPSVSNKGARALKKLGFVLSGLNIKNCKGISNRSLNMLVEDLLTCDILF